jgi:hypothetical protein
LKCGFCGGFAEIQKFSVLNGLKPTQEDACGGKAEYQTGNVPTLSEAPFLEEGGAMATRWGVLGLFSR